MKRVTDLNFYRNQLYFRNTEAIGQAPCRSKTADKNKSLFGYTIVYRVNNHFPKGFILNSLPGKVNHDSRCKWRLLEIYSSNVIRVYKSHVVQGTILGKFHIHEVMGFVQRMLLRH